MIRLSMRWQITRVLWFYKIFKSLSRLLVCLALAALGMTHSLHDEGQHSFWGPGQYGLSKSRGELWRLHKEAPV